MSKFPNFVPNNVERTPLIFPSRNQRNETYELNNVKNFIGFKSGKIVYIYHAFQD